MYYVRQCVHTYLYNYHRNHWCRDWCHMGATVDIFVSVLRWSMSISSEVLQILTRSFRSSGVHLLLPPGALEYLSVGVWYFVRDVSVWLQLVVV